MQTIYDWATMAIFCALAILYLSRSVGPEIAGDRMINYLPPAIGCAAANYLGNKGAHVIAIILIGITVSYIITILKPFPQRPGR